MPPDKKKSLPPVGMGLKEEVTFLLAGLFLLSLIVNQIMNYLYSLGFGDIGAGWNYFLYTYLIPFWGKWKIIAIFLSAACVVWAYYSARKLGQVAKAEEQLFGPSGEEDTILDEAITHMSPEKKMAGKWERVMAHAYSANQADWRLAIMEADIMLDEALRAKGFAGDGVGEMLKGANLGDLVSLDAAWDAHKVRNRIAHSGGDFELNERETRRVVGLFEAVLKELGAI
ncbi:MAG: hypothetical protein A3J09_01715 [Candidatus Zambryskibacteria bacterium RIFCSPLOWO2_02_FULL_51_21]|uniref:DUF4145 domain-containing protein n=1 Tax=Candidatus Zambryskibacteria bacterium RIFCSPHIGHO2_02_FULL_43_37 TaxID=1802749 RepID=A0A1G2TGZ6_9BACT|nr:MAG: hypothetical protein A2723_01715 [Candidatus Zambryskibacteria bacterium RIFCSPHIGHO2_01_FULL_52_18]OHA96483.1 MAG: hypothetical protein A3D49_01185 [Candidatus Zambryskibacteria bacterium RIFCSPHIGHO2_02_FULL_43_37]OHB07153.1 MAG: hypothetical protein A2944_00950 [Candidatus Zambryskibacteria bacterium RIFCSPLOWO2_01_FULL_52_12]OHB11254.1 MAG: hypothetical protein A3J09_01715 [Candidatus Zambryskibacteria bacterium RIFCSPLOWO2_02_FULL_51_21]